MISGVLFKTLDGEQWLKEEDNAEIRLDPGDTKYIDTYRVVQ